MSNKLSAPKNFRVIGRDGAALAQWDEVQGADGYRLQYYLAAEPDKCIKSRYAQEPKKMILGFENGREYLAAVCAFRYKDGREIMGEMSEKVPFVPVCERLKAQNTLCLKNGGAAQLVWECNNKVPEVTFHSEDERIATVSESGLVTAVSEGTTFIEITAKDGQKFRTKAAVERKLPVGKSSTVLMFTGDIMCAVNHQRAVSAYGYDFCDAFSGIKGVLSEADFAAGVLETSCFDGAPYEHEALRLSNGAPNCNSPTSFLRAVSEAGFDALVTANNHNCDTGREGLEATVEAVRSYNMKNIGTLGDNPVIVDVKGIKVGIIAVSMISNGTEDAVTNGDSVSVVNVIGRYDRDYFVELINTAYRRGAEYIVAYQHWGRMNSAEVRKTQTEEARFMAEAGASLIVGSHPHVVQRFGYIKTEDGRRVPCAYSLGNFLTTMQEMRENRDSLILRVELFRAEEGISAKLSYIPCMSETRDFGAAVVPVYPAFGEDSAASFARTKATLGTAIGHFEYRPRVLLSGSANLSRIFSAARGFRIDKTALLLSQISAGRKTRFEAAEEDELRLKTDLQAGLADYVAKTCPEFVAVDFVTAALVPCYKLEGTEEPCFFTGSKAFKRSAFYRSHKERLSKIRPPYGESIWKPLVKNYAEGLLHTLPPERIILFRCRYDTHRAKGTELRTGSAKSGFCRFLTAMEDYFISLVNPAIVDISGGYFPEEGTTGFYETAYYADAYKAAERITAGARAVRVPDPYVWFDRVMKYYRNMTARSYQSWLLDMSNAADLLIAHTSADFAARHSDRIIRLKCAGKSSLAYVKEFFVDEPAAAELVQAAEIIRALLDGDLDRPYDFFALAFKEHFNILKTMVRLLSAEIGAAVNENSVELVFLLRGKAQLKRYIAGLSRMTVDIWGSCVSRESINRSKEAYIGKYIFKQAPILAFEPPIKVEFPEGTEAFCGNKWRRRTMKDSFARNGAELIDKTENRWLLVDFYDLICRMAEYHGGLFEIDDFILRTDFYKSIAGECTECYLFEKRDMKYCFEAITRFANYVSDRYGENIILIKTEPKNTFITLDDRLESMEDDGMFEIKKKFISLCEERFASVTGCYVIDISKHFFASDRFPLGGAHIVHYEEEFYRQTGEYISEILLGTDRRVFSTVDDNYLLLRSLKLGRES